jgi:hypothetical protein
MTFLHNGRARLLAAMIPNAKLEKITGASHLLTAHIRRRSPR